MDFLSILPWATSASWPARAAVTCVSKSCGYHGVSWAIILELWETFRQVTAGGTAN
jgi:hypothetical protein